MTHSPASSSLTPDQVREASAPRYISVGWVNIYPNEMVKFTRFKWLAHARGLTADCETRECFVIELPKVSK